MEYNPRVLGQVENRSSYDKKGYQLAGMWYLIIQKSIARNTLVIGGRFEAFRMDCGRLITSTRNLKVELTYKRDVTR
jgi:hypothetical protein